MRHYIDILKSNAIYILILLFATALVPRLLHVYEIYTIEPYYKNLYLDAFSYDQWGLSIAAGNIIGNEIYYQDPLYPYLLGLIYWTFGHNLTVVVIIQSIFGALSAVLVFLIGKKVFNTTVGIIAFLLWSFYPVIIFYEATIQKEGISVFITLLGIYLVLAASDKQSRKYYFLSGLFLGMSVLTRGNILFILPFIFAGIAYKLKYKSIQAITLISSGLIVVLFPVALRNKIICNEFVLTTSQAGASFYIGNNPGSVGSLWPALKFLRTNPRYERTDFEAEAKRLTGITMSSAEVSRFWFKQGTGFIVGHPLEYVSLQLKKLNLIINNHEVNDNYNYDYYKRFSSILRYSPVSYSLIITLGIFGMLISLASWRHLIILYAFILSYILSLLVFFVVGRYRLQLTPFMAIFASAALYWLWTRIIAKKYSHILASAIVISLIMFCSLADIKWVSSANYADALFFEANRFQRMGSIDKAISNYNELINLNQRKAESHYALGNIYYNRKLLNVAISEYRKALDGGISSASAVIHFKLGTALIDSNNNLEAIDEFKASIAIDPDQVGSYFELARCYENMRMYSESLAYWEALLKHDKNGSCYGLAKSKINELQQYKLLHQ